MFRVILLISDVSVERTVVSNGTPSREDKDKERVALWSLWLARFEKSIEGILDGQLNRPFFDLEQKIEGATMTLVLCFPILKNEALGNELYRLRRVSHLVLNYIVRSTGQEKIRYDSEKSEGEMRFAYSINMVLPILEIERMTEFKKWRDTQDFQVSGGLVPLNLFREARRILRETSSKRLEHDLEALRVKALARKLTDEQFSTLAKIASGKGA